MSHLKRLKPWLVTPAYHALGQKILAGGPRLVMASSSAICPTGLSRLVIVKCGASGAISLCDGHIVHTPAFQIDVVDTTGAGDSFNAGLLYAY